MPSYHISDTEEVDKHAISYILIWGSVSPIGVGQSFSTSCSTGTPHECHQENPSVAVTWNSEIKLFNRHNLQRLVLQLTKTILAEQYEEAAPGSVMSADLNGSCVPRRAHLTRVSYLVVSCFLSQGWFLPSLTRVADQDKPHLRSQRDSPHLRHLTAAH